MMKYKCILCVMLLAFVTSVTSFSQSRSDKIKPQWMKNLPRNNGQSYRFSTIVSSGQNLKELRISSLADLAAELGLEKGVTTVSSYKSFEYDKSTTSQGKESSIESSEFEFQSIINGKPVFFNARVLDEYWEETEPGVKLMTRLYAHSSIDEKANFDSVIITEKYSNDPATWGLSLIPGAAQMHKGSYLKGGLIMGGTVAIAGGLIACESLRKSYMAKISQTHSAEVKKAYNTMAGNCATARNICIGGLAALYIYNIIDAYIAPGARRVIVTPSATADGQYGMSLSYTF